MVPFYRNKHDIGNTKAHIAGNQFYMYLNKILSYAVCSISSQHSCTLTNGVTQCRVLIYRFPLLSDLHAFM